MSKLILWFDNVLSGHYEELLDEDPIYIIERLIGDIDTCKERIVELEVEVSQSDEILAEHDLINYEIIINQSERIAELEEKVSGLQGLLYKRDNDIAYLEDEIDAMLRDRY